MGEKGAGGEGGDGLITFPVVANFKAAFGIDTLGTMADALGNRRWTVDSLYHKVLDGWYLFRPEALSLRGLSTLVTFGSKLISLFGR